MKFSDFSEELKFQYVAFHLEVLSSSEVIEWAGNVLERNVVTEQADLTLLYGLGQKELSEVEGYLEKLRSTFTPKFKLKSPEAKWFGHQVLRAQCQKYLDGKIDPDQLCSIVYPAEGIMDYPAWLGDLYNVCDIIDNEPRKKTSPDHYAEECERILNFDSSHW